MRVEPKRCLPTLCEIYDNEFSPGIRQLAVEMTIVVYYSYRSHYFD